MQPAISTYHRQIAAQARSKRTSLDNHGFSVDVPQLSSTTQEWIFKENITERELMLDVLQTTEVNPKRIRRFRSCGSFAFIETHKTTGARRIKANFCELRACPHCRRRIQWETSQRLEGWLGKMEKKKWRLITLTLAHSDEDLKKQFTLLRSSFRRLRQTKLWKNSQDCGKGIIEVVWNDHRKEWHPHLHILAKGNYIAQKQLSENWKMSSGGSAIVDIRKISNAGKAVHYVAKYLGKYPELGGGEAGHLRRIEYYLATRNAKMIISYGNAGPMPDLELDYDQDSNPENWETTHDLETVIRHARNGCEDSQKILDSIQKGGHPPPT